MQYEEAIAFLKNLCEHVTVPGTSCTMEQNGYYPAMEMVDGADRLLSLYQESCKLLGEPIPQGSLHCQNRSYQLFTLCQQRRRNCILIK